MNLTDFSEKGVSLNDKSGIQTIVKLVEETLLSRYGEICTEAKLLEIVTEAVDCFHNGDNFDEITHTMSLKIPVVKQSSQNQKQSLPLRRSIRAAVTTAGRIIRSLPNVLPTFSTGPIQEKSQTTQELDTNDASQKDHFGLKTTMKVCVLIVMLLSFSIYAYCRSEAAKAWQLTMTST